jgi:hypothetical protein
MVSSLNARSICCSELCWLGKLTMYSPLVTETCHLGQIWSNLKNYNYLFLLFQIVSRSSFSRYITFATYLDINYV